MSRKWHLVALLIMACVVCSGVSFAAPSITSLSPTSGAVGASVTITGTSFGSTQGTSTVKFNGTAATTIGSWSATSIVASVPTGATTGNVVVTVSGTASNGISFTVVSAPSITSLSPTSGAVGTAVTVTGTNFGSTQGTGTVKFNGTTATVTSWSATSIKVTVPTGATTGNVVVFASGVNSNSVAFTVFPSISTLSPTSGAVGASVTITGLNFGSTQGTSTVKFNGTAATTIGSWSTTSIVATVPTGATTGNVVVTVGSNASNGVSFTVFPSISSLSPTTGAVGASVTITGANFGSTQGTSTVKFNGTAATTIGSWSATSIVATVPTGATTGNVVVTVGSNASNGVSFTVVAAPSITSLSPTSGAVGASVTITGTNFGSTQGTSTVKFNGTAATAIGSWSATSIVATVPTGATTGNVVVNASGVNSAGVSFTVVSAPSLTSLSPTSGAVGTAVTVTGTNFGSTQGTGTVEFNGTTASVTSWSATSIKVTVPTGATTGNVVVFASGVNSNGVAFTVFPSISSLSPTSGAVGASVTITGLNFGSTQGTSTVKFNGTAATTIGSWSATSIVATVPTGATTGNVVVTVGSNASNGVSFTVVAAPSIMTVSPTSSAVGASVTITGTSFGSTQGTSTVKFNGTTATTIGSWSATSIVATVPTGATTGNVVVNASGVNSNGVSFTVVAAPSITSVSPTSGAVGASVTITGANFGSTQGTGTLTFNGTTATSIGSWSATSIVATVPTGATSGNVVVNASGVSSNSVSFTVVSAPSITSLSPTSGAVGASVTITGTSFGSTQGTSTVKFNGTTATIGSWSATSIVATLPTGATTGNVIVNASGVNSNGVSFTVVAAPSITSVSPTSGAVGASVTITGANFGSTQGAGSVTFNGTSATMIGSWSATSIVLTVPAGATTGNVVVNASGVNSNGVSFTVVAAPSITSVSPTSGAVGASVTITGTNFGSTQGSGSVSFNGAAATIGSWSSTSIVATVPTGATTGNVIVNASGVNSNGVSFTVVAAPSITTLSPTSGAAGASVTITGANFGSTQGSGSVSFNGTAATAIGGWSATSIVVTVPTGATTGNVLVNASGVNSSSASFTVVAAPSVTSLSPTSGAVGASVTIMGANFGSTQGTGSVSFNGTAATSIGSWTAGSVVATVPTGATAGNVVVNASGVNSNGVSFTVVAAPNITSLSPTSGAVGASVTITGTNFGSPQGTGTLTFNGTTATSIGSWSATSIVATVPTGATTGNVVVNASGVNSNGVSFTVVAVPNITSVSPTSGAVGASVTITGTNFGSTQGSGSVSFNGVAASAIGSWSAASIVVTVPTGATTGNVVVTANGLASNGVSFTVLPTPTITSVSPNSGTVGTSVTITGTNFGSTQGSSSLTFNGTTATTIGTWTATSIVATVPTGATTGNVVVTVSGVASNGVLMTINSSSLPTVAQVQPANASTSVPLNHRVVVRFAQAVQTTAIVPGTLTLSQGSTNLAGSVTLSNDGLSLTFAPSQNLAASTTFTVAVTNVAGGQMSPEFQSAFTTGTTTDAVAPQIAQTSPHSSSTGIPTSAPVVVQFTEPMDPATLMPTSQSFEITDDVSGLLVSGTVDVDPTGTLATFVPQQALGVDRQFQVTLSSTIQDASGNGLSGSGTSFSFTTAFAPDTTSPQVLGVSPANGASAVPVNALVVLTFSKPLDPISVTTAFQVESAGQPVAGGIALSNGNQQITFTPQGGLAANTTYTVAVPAQITDVGGLALSNPATYSFVTGSATDSTTPSVTLVSPANYAVGLSTNGEVQLQFSKPINPLTVTSTTFEVSPNGSGIPPAVGTISVSANGQTATFSPSAPLDSATLYVVQASSGITDIEGHPLSSFESFFTTGISSDTTAPTITTVSPANGQSGVPVNIRVDLVTSAQLSAASVGSTVVALSAGGTQIPGTVSLSSSGTTLSFVPSAQLSVSTTYTLTVSGVTDQAGNVLVPFTSNFSTGASGATNTTVPAVVSVSPVNGTSGVAVGSPVVLTFNEAIDLTTVNDTTVPIGVNGYSGALAGTYSLNSTGTVLTFTPTSPLPGNALITVQMSYNGVADLSGNLSSSFSSTFTTGPEGSTTAPTVVMVTPQNGTTGIGTRAVVVLTFSESLNASTINTNNFGLLVNGTSQATTISISADNRVVTLNPSGLPASSTVSVVVTSAVTDLFGNSLANFESQFTTGPALSVTVPTVVSQRPGTGATGVPLNASIVLYLSQPMNAGTVTGALHVSQNGVLVSGTTQVTDNGQVVQFLPSAAWPANQQVLVYLDSTAQGANGENMNSYQSSFTTQANNSAAAASQVSSNPANAALNVPTNVVIDMAFNESLAPTTLTATTVLCYQNGAWFQSDVSLVNGGTVVQVLPRLPLPANTFVTCQVSTTLQGTNGVPSLGGGVQFTTGSGPDSVVPTIVAFAPPNGSTNVGDNATVRLLFSEPINPLTINSSTIQISGGGTTVVPDSISFSNNNQTVLLVPHAPLPDSTVMTMTISGITDPSGNAIAPQTTQFTTAAGPDVVAPILLWTSPLEPSAYQAPTNIPLNAIVQLQVNEPVDPGTVNSTTFSVTNSSNIPVAGTYSVSANGLMVTFVPAVPFAANQQYNVNSMSGGITDLSGNGLSISVSGVIGNFNFTTGTTSSTSSPQVTGVSPANGATAIPINARAVVGFNEPIDVAKLSGITLTGPGGAVAVSQTASNGDQTIALVPVSPLTAGTLYTMNVTGVQDLSGNVLTSPTTSTFTTGNSADLVAPKEASTTPANYATGVSTTGTVQVQFSKVIDPLTVTPATFYMYPYSTSVLVPGTISASGTTATFTPTEPLDSQTFYSVQVTTGITDMEGQNLSGSASFYFTTGQGSTSPAPNISTVSPVAGAAVGATVTIDGEYFGTTQGSSTVKFNGVPATATTWNDVQIIVTVPTGASTGPLVVTVNGATSNSANFTVLATPSITTISPSSAPIGTVLTITGTNFGDAQDSVTVQFNAGTYPFPLFTPLSRTPTSITIAVPSTAETGYVYVFVDGLQSNEVTFTLVPTPTLASLTPSSGVAGTPVGINGTNFGSTQGSSTVSFNGVPPASITSWTNNYVVAVPPSNVTTGPVTMVVNSIPSNNNVAFTVTDPAIGSLSPPSGGVGATITVTGSGLTSQGLTTQVFFNGLAGYITSSSSGSVTVQVPTNATTGSVTVEVGAVTSNSAPFTVEQPPTITSVSPNQGPFGGITGVIALITISGSGFGATQSDSTVNFWESSTPPSIQSWSDSAITLYVPGDALTGPLTVQVGGLTVTAPSWFIVNQVTQLTDSFGNQTDYSFSIQGGNWVTTASQGPGCSTCSVRGNTTNVLDHYGNLLTHTDDLNNTTTYTYDSSNDMTSASKPLNTSTTQTTSYTYNSFGEVLTMTDPLGNVTTNTYDAHGNLLTVTTPQPSGNTAASVTQFQYATNGELTQITDPLNNVTKLTYNSVGLIATITDAQQNVTSYQYDPRGNRTAVIDPINGAAHPTSFTFDIMSRLTGITYPDGSTVGFTYDSRGRRITATDQNNKTTTYTYDTADRLTEVTDPALNNTHYAYDTEDNLLSITDANNHVTQFAYNARGWVTQTTFPSTLTESYNYDLVGNLLSKTDRKNQTIQYVYDALYRLSSKTYPDTTAVEYAYDLAGKVQQVSDPTGTYGFSYDNMGRLLGTSTQYAYLPGFNFQNAYTYDAGSNRTSLTTPDGSVSTYGYDTLNRLNGLANSWAGSFGFSYDALSRRTQLTRPNGIATNYSYDPVSHLLSVLHQAGANTLDGASYTYDPAGNRTAKTNDLNAVTSNYSYDPLYELTQVTQGASTTETYSYDFVGNRLSSSGVPTYNYNSSNELTSNSLGSYTYDANGNTLTEANGNSYSWDFENRLTQAVVPGTNGGDLLPIFRTKLSMISAKERGSGYVEEQSHRGADDRGAETTGSGPEGGRCGAGSGGVEAHDLRLEGEVRRDGSERSAGGEAVAR